MLMASILAQLYKYVKRNILHKGELAVVMMSE